MKLTTKRIFHAISGDLNMRKIISPFIHEPLLLSLMLLSLLIPSRVNPIVSWTEVSPLAFLRASIWLFGLLILPGLYLLRLTRVAENVPKLTKIALAINISFVLIGIASLILHISNGNIILLPWIFLVVLLPLFLVQPFRNSPIKLNLSRWRLLLLVGTVMSIFISFSVQLAQRYLITGDIWVSSTSAVQVISGGNVYTGQYPVFFGFILAGLSICSGLPVVNTYVLLFPLIALNMLSFFALAKNVFNLEEKVAVIASMIYAFTGGLGWLIETVVYHGNIGFWTLSDLTQDMYFSPMWHSIIFYYKTLALTLACTSLVTFALSLKAQGICKKTILITLSSILILSSFYIHMVETIVFLPVILAIGYIYQKGRCRYVSLGFFALITTLLFFLTDFLMSGYYSWLTITKIEGAFLSVNKLFLCAVLSLGLIMIIIIMVTRHLHIVKRYLSSLEANTVFPKLKTVLTITSIVIYVSGIYFWSKAPQNIFVYQLTPLPWYYYTTRYGFVGLLALIGLGLAKWRTNWFKVACFWCLVTLFIGNIWWSNVVGFLTLIIALFVAIGLNGIWERAGTSLKESSNSVKRSFKLNLKPLIATLIIALMLLSSSSLIFMANYYTSSGPCISDDTARAFAWINENVPKNHTVLVPNIYNIYQGVKLISRRQIYLNDKIPTSMDALINTLDNHNIRYMLTFEVEDETSVLRVLLSCSTLVFQSGDVKVFRLPFFSQNSSYGYSVAVVDQELLGFSGDLHELGWIDDNFEGWSYKNVNASSNGEILTYKWQLRELYESESIASKTITPVDTSKYPYLIIKYRNTAESIPVTQMITLVNETGYPKGFIKNLYLPSSKGDAFVIFMARLPQNQKVAQIWIWMRNWGNLNGTTGLQVDYIGFTSRETTPELHLRFLSMAIPALWPTNYSICSSFNDIGDAPILVSTYDRSVPYYIEKATNVHTFVFLNLTASFPSWGMGWRNVKAGIISGSVDGKKVVIVGIEQSDEKDLVTLAESIYEEIKD